MYWYQREVPDVFAQLKAAEAGLSDNEVSARLAAHGPNRLADDEAISRLAILLRQFASPLIYILLIAAGVTAALGELKDTAVIAAVVLFNAVVGYFQEHKAEQSVRALKRMVVPRARVVRDGREREIDSADLVPGDVVVLASGLKVPADLRLFKTIELRVDESMLTGESVPAEKTTAAIGEQNLPPGDQRNLAFMGTVVVNGRARGVVVETGSRTVLGSIAREVREAGSARAPLQEKFHRFSNRIGIVVLSASVLLFGIGVLVGETIKEMFMTAVAAAVATIPEGLPAVLTIALAVGVRNMAKRNAIVRKLPAVETLGSTTVICTDKTGTLTKNEMTVKVLYDGEHVFEVTGTGYTPDGEVLHEWVPVSERERSDLFMCLRVGLLCNESNVYQENSEYKVDGDPTEAALIVSAMKAGLVPDDERRSYPQAAIIPFESDRGYMATLHRHGNRKFLFVKGAPEKVLELCTSCSTTGGVRAEAVLRTAHLFAKEGMRVLAMAYKEVPLDVEEITHADVEGDLVLVGLQGMIDPPRPEAIEAVKGCRRAGIRVVMITGDHATTAHAIGKMIGIAGDDSGTVTGKELEQMDDAELAERVRTVSVYARVAPHHKLRIVQHLLKQGEIVAVTGDGVNDAPALKAAHLGVAMGRTGTDVAKEAADMVIADDNFATIFHAVSEGRVVFDNIRKVTFFLIPTGVAAILSIIGTIFLGLPMPYTPTQILWINLVTNGMQVIALTFEPGEADVIDRPPRRPSDGVMSRTLIERTVIVGTLIAAGVVYKFYHVLVDGGGSLEKARTVAVTTMVFFQFFQTWNSRSETRSLFSISPFSNPFLVYAIGASIFAQLAVLYVPGLQWVFGTEPLGVGDWVKIGAMALTVIVAVEIDKWIRARRSRHV